MSMFQILAVLYARKWTVLSVIAITMGTAAAISHFVPPRYTATATVYIDLRASERLGSTVLPQDHAASYMATQMDIIRSPRVALEVVNKLGLAKSEEVRKDFEKDTGGAGSIEYWTAEQILKNVEVRPSRESSVINVTYVARDAEASAQIANAFVDTYISTQIRLRTDPAQKSAELFGDRSAALRQDLDRAQKQLSEYQKRQGLVVTDERLDSELGRLDQLTRQLTEAQAQTTDARSRKQLADDLSARNADADSHPEITGNQAIVALKAELSRQDGRLRELEARLGTNHPLIEQAQAEANNTRQRLRSETRNILAGIANAVRIAEARESRLESALAAQRSRVLEMRRARDQASLLTRDIESAQRALESSRERQTTSRLESQVTQTNASVLNPAVTPVKPTFPRMRMNLLIAGILGTLLGAGVAIAREGADRRLRDVDDLSSVPDMPVLGTIGSIAIPAAEALTALPGPESVILHHDERSASRVHLLAAPKGEDETDEDERAQSMGRALGAIMIQDGRLTPDEVDRIVRTQSETGASFVDTARQLKLLTPEEAHEALARHFDYPRIPAEHSVLSRELVALHTPFSPEVEAMRALRSQLMLRWFSEEPSRHVLAIVGIERGSGRSFLAANLAVLFAQVGMRTLLVDADLRAPRQHQIFGIGNSLGLSTLLAEHGAPDAIRRINELPNLAILPAGLVPPNPQELVARRSLVSLINGFAASFDVILIDTPALAGCADAQLIAARARGALMVAKKGVTRASTARAVSRGLGELGATRVGLLLNEHAVA